MMKMYDKSLTYLGDLDVEIDNEKLLGESVVLTKKINNIYNLKFNAYNLSPLYAQIINKNIIEIDDDFYVIETVKQIRDTEVYKQVSAYQVSIE